MDIMKRFKVILSYDGSAFNGYQKQPSNKLRSVQGEFENALFKIHKKEINSFASGRTDAQVHALNQVLHFDSDSKMNGLQMKKALNSNLAKDVYVKQVEIVKDDFHARFNAISKEYHFLLNTGEYDLFKRNYVYQFNKELDIEKMKKAALLFVGKHDFKNFSCGLDRGENSFIRTIEKLEIIQEKKIIRFVIIGDGFLRYMVRMIVGILLEIGKNKKDFDFIKIRLDNQDSLKSNYKVSGVGLYLVNVNYN